MDREILVQYCEMKEEIRDIGRRMEKLRREINSLDVVADSVKGTRPDGTYGSIKIVGYPAPEYDRKRKTLERYEKLLAKKETELLELTCQVEEYIDGIQKSELRTMFRLYYIDGYSYQQVAYRMNRMNTRRKIKYTDENVRKRIKRFFENFKNVHQCPGETC